MRRGALIGLCLGMLPCTTWAGAWPLPKGETQAILKYEGSDADSGFDPSGLRQPIPHLRADNLSLFVEYGLTDRLTLQAKADATSGEDQFVRYSGRGPTELGLRYAVVNSSQGVLSLYLGATAAGVGQNAGYAPPHAGDGDVEARLLAGRNATLWGQAIFGEAQAARLFRRGLPDETHLDLTLGWTPRPRWLVLTQAYAGRADPGGTNGPVAPEWVKLETSVVRRLGRWSVQFGWRETVYGKETPVEQGPVIGLWRRF